MTTFKLDGDQYDVILQLEDDGRRTPEQLQQIYVRNSQGQMLPLSTVLTMKETVSPAELNHFNKLRSAKITASLADGYALGDAVTFMQKSMEEINDPAMSYDKRASFYRREAR